jgi:hypothetical protein
MSSTNRGQIDKLTAVLLAAASEPDFLGEFSLARRALSLGGRKCMRKVGSANGNRILFVPCHLLLLKANLL